MSDDTIFKTKCKKKQVKKTGPISTFPHLKKMSSQYPTKTMFFFSIGPLGHISGFQELGQRRSYPTLAKGQGWMKLGEFRDGMRESWKMMRRMNKNKTGRCKIRKKMGKAMNDTVFDKWNKTHVKLQ